MNLSMNLPTPLPRVFEVTQDNFESDVLQASLDTPILIDFWATWCGPCKALGPVLEKLAEAYQGAFRLGKVDVDHEQALAQAFGIRSIPTVMLVVGGKPVDGFSGALPEAQVREFLGRHLSPLGTVEGGTAPDEPAAAEPAEAPKHAVKRLRRELAAHPEQETLRLDLARALLQAGQLDEAEQELAALPVALATDARANTLRSRLELARTLRDAPAPGALEKRIQRDAEDWEARDLLGVHLLLGADPAAGLEQFLHVLEHAPQWRDGQAKKRLLAAFAILEDPALVASCRRRMASLLF